MGVGTGARVGVGVGCGRISQLGHNHSKKVTAPSVVVKVAGTGKHAHVLQQQQHFAQISATLQVPTVARQPQSSPTHLDHEVDKGCHRVGKPPGAPLKNIT